MTMLEDLRLALRQICRAIGLHEDAATVVSLVVLGVALNLVALRTVQYAGVGGHTRHNRTERTALRSAAHTELKVMRTVVISTLRKIDGGRRWCQTRQRMLGQTEGRDDTGYHVEGGAVWAAPAGDRSCEAMVSRSGPRMAIAPGEC